MLSVAEIMTREPYTLGPDDTLRRCAPDDGRAPYTAYPGTQLRTAA